MARKSPQADLWSIMFNSGMVALEAQAVITMRVWGMAGLWSVTPAENQRMLDEKTQALQKAWIAAGSHALSGAPPQRILSAALEPIRAKTRSNSKRLAKRGPRLGP